MDSLISLPQILVRSMRSTLRYAFLSGDALSHRKWKKIDDERAANNFGTWAQLETREGI